MDVSWDQKFAQNGQMAIFQEADHTVTHLTHRGEKKSGEKKTEMKKGKGITTGGERKRHNIQFRNSFLCGDGGQSGTQEFL